MTREFYNYKPNLQLYALFPQPQYFLYIIYNNIIASF